MCVCGRESEWEQQMHKKKINKNQTHTDRKAWAHKLTHEHKVEENMSTVTLTAYVRMSQDVGENIQRQTRATSTLDKKKFLMIIN